MRTQAPIRGARRVHTSVVDILIMFSGKPRNPHLQRRRVVLTRAQMIAAVEGLGKGRGLLRVTDAMVPAALHAQADYHRELRPSGSSPFPWPWGVGRSGAEGAEPGEKSKREVLSRLRDTR